MAQVNTTLKIIICIKKLKGGTNRLGHVVNLNNFVLKQHSRLKKL